MAEKKEKKYVSADTGETMSNAEHQKEKVPNMKEAKPVGNASGLRVGAVVLWLLGLAMEVLAVLILFGKLNITALNLSLMTQLIIFLVLDFIFVLIGSQLWKKANHIKPASEANKFKFWLWNNLGVIMSVICFAPLIVLVLTNKDTDKKTKTVVTIVAAVLMAVCGLGSYDFNPVSLEEQEAAVNAISGTVYWSPHGTVYHTHDDCQAITNSEELTFGTVEQAIAAGRTRLCKFCANEDEITGVKTDGEIEEVIEDVVEEVAEETVEPAA